MYLKRIFKKKSSLTRHMKMHIPSSAISCKLCKREFADNGALDKHTAEAHPKLPNNEEQHARILIRHWERYICEFCGLKIGYRKSLRRHLRNKHPDRKIEWNSEEAIDSMMTKRYKKYKARKTNFKKREKDDMQSNVRNINYTIQAADLLINDEALNIDEGQIQLYGSDMEQVLFSSSISLLENVQPETVQSLAIDEECIVDIELDD